MELCLYILSVIPLLASSITIISNGNSPDIKMVGGMMVDTKKGFTPYDIKTQARNNENGKTRKLNNTMLSINERYRRLIPYMTFYYANDGLVTTTADPINAIDIEVEKAQIIEASVPMRDAKKIVHSSYRNVPRYQGNRLTQYNIASSNPPKSGGPLPSVQHPPKLTPNYNPLIIDQNFRPGYVRFPQKSNVRVQDVPLYVPARKPVVDLFHSDDNGSVRYYYSEKNPTQRFKLVPYEQTPIRVVTENDNVYKSVKETQNAPIASPEEQIYIKSRPNRPDYGTSFDQPEDTKKPAVIVVKDYFDKSQGSNYELKTQPIIETGFKPIIPQSPVRTTQESLIITTTPTPVYDDSRPVAYETVTVAPEAAVRYQSPNYYQYAVEESQKPEVSRDSSTLSEILNLLQKSKSVPKPITRENVGSSIRTLLQVLSTLKVAPYDEGSSLQLPVLSTAKPFTALPKVVVHEGLKPVSEVSSSSSADRQPEFHREPYLAPVNLPSQHLDDYRVGVVSSQQFPLPTRSEAEGGTPGRPGHDYPTLTSIPPTKFDCKTQRYKGFFADPETRCQVWHYCDLNGGQASFLCPNGTIFSQAGLTCDWWYNVRCASTAQLYVLNESLYKYILPHSPKFPEDYSGPLVDKYLTLKFKEMEEQFRKNKNKQTADEKMDTESDDKDSQENYDTETTELNSSSETNEVKSASAVSEASVIVENTGSSGNVERLHD